MRIVADSYLGLNAVQIWYPETSAAVIEHLSDAPLVTVMQCGAGTADELASFSFRNRDFHTVLIDLDRPQEELWANLEKRTCRYQINRAKKMEHAILLNERLDDALALFNDFFRRTRFRAPLGDSEWRRVCEHADIFLALHQDRPIAAHAILADPPMRVRALMSATADRADAADRSAAGALNRLLHWHEIGHYRDLGLHWYDFGGIVVDENAPEFSITQFKRSFNGQEVRHHVLRLARNPLLRAALRGACRSRALLRPPTEAAREQA